MGNVAIFEAATGGALKYVHVPGLLKLADATDNEPHLALAAVRPGVPRFQLLVAHPGPGDLVSQRTDFNPQPRLGKLHRRSTGDTNEVPRRGTKRGRRPHRELSPQ